MDDHLQTEVGVTLLSTLAQENRSVAGGPVPLLLKIAPHI